MNSIVSFIKHHTLAALFVLVFALEGVATLLFIRDPATLPFALVLTPMLAAVTLAAVTEGWSGVRALLRTLLRWRVGLQWYVVALGLPMLVGLVIVGVAVLLAAPTGNLFGDLLPAMLILPLVVLLPAF